MSMPYDEVPVDSDGSKLRPSPSIDAGPLGRLSFVRSTPLAPALRAHMTRANANHPDKQQLSVRERCIHAR